MKSTLGTLFCFLILGIFLMNSTAKAQAARGAASGVAAGAVIRMANGD